MFTDTHLFYVFVPGTICQLQTRMAREDLPAGLTSQHILERLGRPNRHAENG